MHKSCEQTNNFGKLYFHSGRGGIDICLSDSYDYFLSLLLKTTYVFTQPKTKEACTQTTLAKKFKNKYNNEIVLEPRKESLEKEDVFLTKRVGLVKDSYKDELLGAIIKINDKNAKFSFAKGFGKEKTVKQKFGNQPDKIKEYLGYYLK